MQKKICMLGATAVGKTSLIARFVHNMFSTKYHTTIGVKIDKKSVQVNDVSVNMMLWDQHGDDRFQRLQGTYLRGASGYLLVADGTRKSSLDTAEELHELAAGLLGPVPYAVLLNKSDLTDEWALENSYIEAWRARCPLVILTSAKSGEGVDEAFTGLAREILDERR